MEIFAGVASKVTSHLFISLYTVDSLKSSSFIVLNMKNRVSVLFHQKYYFIFYYKQLSSVFMFSLTDVWPRPIEQAKWIRNDFQLKEGGASAHTYLLPNNHHRPMVTRMFSSFIFFIFFEKFKLFQTPKRNQTLFRPDFVRNAIPSVLRFHLKYIGA